MFIYMTSGTFPYLKAIQENEDNQDEHLILMQNENATILLHETDGETIFKEPRRYEVFESSGTVGESKFAVMNNIPVTDEGRPVFEYRFKNRSKLIDKQPGFAAIRVLRPVKSDTYIVLTYWKDEISFSSWKESQSFEAAHGSRDTPKTKKKKKKIFPRPAYVTKYTILHEED